MPSRRFVVSSADFGRAYLSLGWATRFIQALLSRFQVLFVGYTADDPPVQSLLEGLNLRAGTRNRLSALQHGDERSAVALWEHRGVQAIPFDDFGGLWDTLGAWAARARDGRGWHEATFARAASGPKGLLPHERGQVAHVLSTAEGVRRVVSAAKPLNAEWLLVADPSQRYAPPDGITGPVVRFQRLMARLAAVDSEAGSSQSTRSGADRSETVRVASC